VGRKFLKQATFLVIVAQVILGAGNVKKMVIFRKDQRCRALKNLTICHGLVVVWITGTCSKMQNKIVFLLIDDFFNVEKI
jgi:hypothetical protein